MTASVIQQSAAMSSTN